MSSSRLPETPSKVICVGRNYAPHAAELNNPLPQQPLLFIKPSTAVSFLPQITIPSGVGECHHELELAIRIGQRLSKVSAVEAQQAIAGYGLALDLTLRDVQAELKALGQPWERAKAFDGSCVLSPWINPSEFHLEQDAELQLLVNNELRQHGHTASMLFSAVDLIVDISQQFTLLPGDVVLTGTPAGVGALHSNDRLELRLQQNQQQWSWQGEVKQYD